MSSISNGLLSSLENYRNSGLETGCSSFTKFNTIVASEIAAAGIVLFATIETVVRAVIAGIANLAAFCSCNSCNSFSMDMKNWATSSTEALASSANTVTAAARFLQTNLACQSREPVCKTTGSNPGSVIWDDPEIKNLVEARVADVLIHFEEETKSAGIYGNVANLVLFDYIFGTNKTSPIPEYLKYTVLSDSEKVHHPVTGISSYAVIASGEAKILEYRQLAVSLQQAEKLSAFYKAKVAPMGESAEDTSVRQDYMKELEREIPSSIRLEAIAIEVTRDKRFNDFVHSQCGIFLR